MEHKGLFPCSQETAIQSTPSYHISLRSIMILSFHLRLSFPSSPSLNILIFTI